MKSTKMLVQYSLSQLYRTPIKTVMLLTVMGMVCVFLCVSLNLRQTVKKNIHLLKEEFDVVAVNNEGKLYRRIPEILKNKLEEAME